MLFASEVLLPVVEAELVALELEDLPQLGRAAEEDGDFPLPLLGDLLEHPVPVGPARVRPGLEARDQIALRLGGEDKQKIERQLTVVSRLLR